MRCCENCKWYILDERINDEKGKHVCYGHFFISTPFLYVDSVGEKNQCNLFEEKQKNMSKDELEYEWWNNKKNFR